MQKIYLSIPEGKKFNFFYPNWDNRVTTYGNQNKKGRNKYQFAELKKLVGL